MIDLIDLDVACGCGRRMTPDSLRGAGSMRCGCGARLTIKQIPHPSNDAICVIRDCAEPVWHQRLPETRLCREHFDRLLLEIMPFVFAKYPVIAWTKAANDYQAKYGEFYADLTKTLSSHAVDLVERTERRKDPAHAPLVYFIVWGDRCKIGTTTRLSKRLTSLSIPQSALRGTIPGDKSVESTYHRMFRRQRIGSSEWFTIDTELGEFLENLAA